MKHLFLLLPLLLGLPLFVFAQESTSGFIPLTNIPQLTDLGNSFALDNFLNQLYRISIGIAAVVAVLQIMRAGIMYMGGDSVTNKKEARDLIGLSIGGLVLVLSPFIVFSIVNPSILSLKIDTSNLGTEIGRATSDPIACVPACRAGETCGNDGVCRDVPDPTIDRAVCSLTYAERRSVAVPSGQTCASTLDSDWENISAACCISVTPGGTCCGRKPQQPLAPDTGAGFRYRIAILDTDRLSEDILNRTRQCVRFQSELLQTQVDCAGAVSYQTTLLSSRGAEFEITKNCPTAERTTHRFSNFPTCAQ